MSSGSSRVPGSSWLLLVVLCIACACGGGHDATSGPEPLRESTPFAVGDPGTCSAINLAGTGTGTTTTGSTWGRFSPPYTPATFTIPSTIAVSTGTSTGYSVYLDMHPTDGDDDSVCEYTPSDALTYTVSTCTGTPVTPGNPFTAGGVGLTLVLSGSGGNVTLKLALGGVPLTDGNPCTTDMCTTGGGVTHTVVSDGTPCSGGGVGGVCNGTQLCMSGSCVAGMPLPTANPNPCMTCTCNSTTGSVCVSNGTCSPPPGYSPSGFDSTIATSLVNSASFLWSPTGLVNPTQVAVVRGRVLTGATPGTPVSGAIVSILNHPESTTPTGTAVTTRSDGWFDIPVNGGSRVTVKVQSPSGGSYFPVQRHVQTKWHQYAVLDNIWMTLPDTTSNSPVTLGSASYQNIKGKQNPNSADITGYPVNMPNRTARVLFPPSTTASFTYGPCGLGGFCPTGQTCTTATNLCTGTTPPSSLTVRATEYTVGATGPASMPADNPPASNYTYAVELSADEAISGGAVGIAFNNPVIFYVENFLNFTSGTEVPVGYYDVNAGQWVGMPDGKVIGITDIQFTGCSPGPSPCAVLDGSSGGFGISGAELNQLATIYSGSTFPISLWRVTTTHFTTLDLNWPPPGASPPPPPPPPYPSPPPPVANPCYGGGSIIECDNQILAQQLPLAGTPFSLRYQSDRTAGAPTLTVTIPLTSPAVPAVPGAVAILVKITAAGVAYNYEYDPDPAFKANQSMTWTWDRLDPYGNVVQGMQTADVAVSYVYPPIYAQVEACVQGICYEAFTGAGLPAPGSRGSDSYVFTFENSVQVGAQDAEPLGLGGWTLSANHVYDPEARILWGGDGKRRTLEAATSVIQTLGGTAGSHVSAGDGGPAINATFQNPIGIAAAPDGSYYVADYLAIRHVNAQGVISHFAGDGLQDGPCSGTCVASTSWVEPSSLAVGPDSSVYVASELISSVIQKIDPSGHITTIAGNASMGGSSCADGPLGTGLLEDPQGHAVAPDGSLLIADPPCHTLRRLGTNGLLVTLTATTGCGGGDGDNGPAASACLGTPTSVAVAADGTIYVANSSSDSCGVRRIDPHTGFITLFAGRYTPCASSGPPAGDGVAATSATFGVINGLSVGSDGTLYISDYTSGAIWSVDTTGIAHVLAGGLPNTANDNGGPALQGYVPQPLAVAAGPNATVYMTLYDTRVRSITPSFPGYSQGTSGTINTYIPAQDGSQVFGFDTAGRHIATLDGTTGATLLTFAYDPGTHQITSAVDANSNTTSFAHASGSTTITPPFGQPSSQRTVLGLNGSGYATSLTNPNSETTLCTYSNGLMQTFKTPAGNLHQFTYDSLGELLTDQDPTGATQYLTRTFPPPPLPVGLKPGANWTVAMISGAGHTTNHVVTNSTAGTLTQSVVSPSGATGSVARASDDVYVQSAPDGTVTTVTTTPDPRFGMLDPYAETTTVTTPSTLTQNVIRSRTATPGGSPSSILTPATLGETVTVNGNASSMAYSSTAPATRTFTSAATRKVAQQIDSQGRVTQVSYPTSTLLAPTTFNYDTHGRLSSMVTTSGTRTRTTSLTYDSPGLSGYLATVTDPMADTTTFDQRDFAGRVTDVQLPNFSSHPKSKYTPAYDADGNLASLIVPPATSSSSTHAFVSNSLDLLGTYEPPEGTLGYPVFNTSYAYNADRQILTVAIPHGGGTSDISYSYDADGRLATVLDALSGVGREYAYNSADQVSTISTTDGFVLTNTYDGFLKTSTAWSGGISGSIGWTFDDFFRVSQRTVNSGSTVTYAYDADSLFTGTTSPATFSVTRDYTNLYGRISATTLGTASDTWGYNPFGELLTYTATTNSGATTRYSMTGVTRNNNGQITVMTELVNGVTHTWSFAYDQLSRLTSATRDTTTNTYTYDVNGNRLTLNGAASTYDVQDRIQTAPNGVSFNYTHDGTLMTQVSTSLGTRTLTYDLSGVLRSVVLENGNTVTYDIDGLNRRIGRHLKWGATTINQQFLYEGGRVVAELNGSTVTSVFVYGTKANVPDYMWRGSKAYRIVSDQLGSVRLVLDTTTNPATVIQQFDYDEFGNVLSTSNDTTCAVSAQCFPFQPFGFAGGLQDRDTGLVRFGARDYQPLTGRWVSKDPIRFAGGTTNLFVYAGEDPLNRIDVNGLFGIFLQVGVYFGAGLVPGVGFEGNIGVFIDFSQPLGANTLNPYWEVGGGLAAVTLVSFGAGLTAGFALDSKAFWGAGSEVGFNSPMVGPDATFTSDGKFNGFGIGVGPAFGGDVHGLTSSTQACF